MHLGLGENYWKPRASPSPTRDDHLLTWQRLCLNCPEICRGPKARLGPFASLDFERSHAHAVIVGPGGIEERNDVRIGLTALAPYTRFPDHTQYQARAFLALSSMDFCSESDSWKKLGIGDVSYSGAGELVALLCTTKPLLMLWCNAERR